MRKLALKVRPDNLPANFGWIHSCWLIWLTLKVYEADQMWYVGFSVYTALSIVGFFTKLYQSKFVDLFEGLSSEDSI